MESNRRTGPVVPNDAIVEMFERLPAKYLHMCKCVSKAWCALVTDPLHRERFAQTLAGFLCVGITAGNGVCDTCRLGSGDSGAESSCRHVTRRFINVSGMAEPLVDAAFHFLPPPPPSEFFRDAILDCRDGFVLLGRFRAHETPGLHPPACYLVCNPATAQYATVPPSGWAPGDDSGDETARTYLLFDAAARHRFHLLQFWEDDTDTVRAVHTYSSETGAWTDRQDAWHDGGWRDWGRGGVAPIQPGTGSAVARGALHLVVDTDSTHGPNNLVAVDETGRTRRTVPLPGGSGTGAAAKDWYSVFVALSQGRLHCVTCVRPRHGRLSEDDPLKLLVWVLKDYDAGEWAVKHAVTFPELFGRVACRFRVEYSVVALHPDGNRVFLARQWDRKLLAYDMDRREVLVVGDLGPGYDGCGDELHIAPYVPLYSKCEALANY